MTTERSIIVGKSVKKWRRRMRTAGRCVNCGRLAKGRSRCRACADRDNAAARERRARAKKAVATKAKANKTHKAKATKAKATKAVARKTNAPKATPVKAKPLKRKR